MPIHSHSHSHQINSNQSWLKLLGDAKLAANNKRAIQNQVQSSMQPEGKLHPTGDPLAIDNVELAEVNDFGIAVHAKVEVMVSLVRFVAAVARIGVGVGVVVGFIVRLRIGCVQEFVFVQELSLPVGREAFIVVETGAAPVG